MPLNRETAVTYLGHATLLIESPRGKRILIDPFTTNNPACPAEWKDPAKLGKLDYILFTHIHNDHAQDGPAIIAANPDATVIATYEICMWMLKKGAKSIDPMNKGGTITAGGIDFTLTQAIHSNSFEEQDGTIVYGGEAAGFVIKFENGFTIYDAGDTALFSDMSLIKQTHRPKLAFLPIGDRFTMGPRDAAHAARLLEVTHVVPIHYATFPLLTGTPEEFISQTKGIDGLQVHVLRPGETLR